jgi:hypothetical protein
MGHIREEPLLVKRILDKGNFFFLTGLGKLFPLSRVPDCDLN